MFATATSTLWYFKVNKARKDNYAAFYQVWSSLYISAGLGIRILTLRSAPDPDPNPLVGSGSGSYCSFSSLNSFNKKSKIGDNLRGVPTSVSGAKLLRPAKVKKAQKLYRF